MTLDELRIRIRQICEEASPEQTWFEYDQERTRIARGKLGQLFSEHRNEVFEISKRVDWPYEVYPDGYYAKWSQFEKELAEGLPEEYSMLRRRAIAFFTCSCGSREDSCSEDGDGNFSTFVFTPGGDVFRIVEKKA